MPTTRLCAPIGRIPCQPLTSKNWRPQLILAVAKRIICEHLSDFIEYFLKRAAGLRCPRRILDRIVSPLPW